MDTPVGLVKGLDISKYAGLVPAHEWEQAFAKGERVAVVGSWHGRDGNGFAQSNLINARQAQFATATYVVLNSLPGSVAVKEAAVFCGSEWENLAFVALDVEVAGVTRAIIAEAKDAVRYHHPRALVCIYTGRWFWDGQLGNPTWGRDLGLPLWDSRYDGMPNLDYPDPYGGWEHLIGRQYQGTNKAVGFSTDLSVFSSVFMGPIYLTHQA